MNVKSRRKLLQGVGIAAMSLVASVPLLGKSAWAQDFPSKPIRIIVPTNAGGGNDFIARTIAKKLEESLKVSVVVENKPGASTIIASDFVAKAAPDGYTILFNGPPLIQVASLYKKVPFDPLNDFIPLTDIIRTPLWFVVNPERVPAKNIKEFSELVASQPDRKQDTFASVGSGTSLHLFGHGLNEAAKLNMMHIPYKGGAPAILAVASGEVSSAFMDYATSRPYVEDGKIRFLAVTGTKRSPLTPEVPTLAESGFAGFESYGWGALFLPAKTPQPIVNKLYTEVDKAIQDPAVITSMKNMGFEMGGTPQAEFTALVKSDFQKWANLIKQSGVQLD